MKSSWKINLSLSLAGMCLTAGLLGAADVSGSFTLPHQTRWGMAVLPAGDYTFTLDHAALNGLILIRRGNTNVAITMAQGVSSAGSSESSSMLIVENRVSPCI